MGVSEEDQVRNVEVEVGEERGDEGVPLPHGIGPEAVDEEEVWFGWSGGFRDPDVDDGAIAEVGGGGFEAGIGKGVF